MERVALTVQCADGVRHAGKSRLDAAGNKGRGATSKAQAFLFGWGPDSHHLAHVPQPIHLVGAIKAPVIGSSPDSPAPGIWLEQAVSHHPVPAGPRLHLATPAPGEKP